MRPRCLWVSFKSCSLITCPNVWMWPQYKGDLGNSSTGFPIGIKKKKVSVVEEFSWNTEGIIVMWSAFCYTEAAHQDSLCKRDFCCSFIYKAQEGPRREHLQCSQSHLAADNKHAVRIKVSLCNTADITRHPVPAGSDEARSHLHSLLGWSCISGMPAI